MQNIKSKMTVEIWSDIMCPFCYMGKRKFERALEKFPHKDSLEITWKSFQLNPELITDTTKSIYQYLSEVKGMDIQHAKDLNSQLADAAKELGLELNFDKVIVANTLKAQKFVHLAAKEGMQDEAEEALFKAFFKEGKNVDDIIVLAEIGNQLGLNTENLDERLNADSLYEEVRMDLYEAHQFRITGVPFFAFNRKFAVSGAQEPEVFFSTLTKAFAEWRTEMPVTELVEVTGQVCSTDGNCN